MNSATSIEKIAAGLARRHAAERRFRTYGLAAIGFACVMLAVLLVTIIGPGVSGFVRHEVRVDVDTAALLAARDAPDTIDFYRLTNAALMTTAEVVVKQDADAMVFAHDTRLAQDAALRHQFLALTGTFAAADMKRALLQEKARWGQVLSVWVPVSSSADLFLKGRIDAHQDAAQRPLNDAQIAWLEGWAKDDDGARIRTAFNGEFFTHGDSRAPEAAGFGGAIVGSLLTLVICLALALPIAIMAAITLEEFARKTRLAGWLEVAINNLAAVPSIIYGLLGLSVFLQVMQLPRSSALVGGLTLAMLILPVMIIAARASIRAVPPSMRQAAAALGATKLQVVRHHVLPYAWPGIMTGTILSICRALGETAPLLMIGMVAFVADVPRGFTDPATAMPVEIYLWASSPEMGFVEKTSSGIMVLLVILLLLNMAAIRVRNRSQLTWS